MDQEPGATPASSASGTVRSDPANALQLFAIVFETLRHEGNAIWERFNIIIGVNLALFGGLGLVSFGASRPAYWRGISIGLGAAGLAISGWSYRVLDRLWNRHAHWRATLVSIQQQFPAGWVRPLDPSDRGPTLTKPYLVILIAGWAIVLGLLLLWPAVFQASSGATTVPSVSIGSFTESAMEWSTFWTAFGAVATAVGALAIGFAAFQLRFETWLKAQEVFTEDGFVSARSVVFRHFDDAQQPWPKIDDENARKVCRKMDELARLESFVTLPRRKILEVWGNPVAKAWMLLKPTVEREREVAHWDEKWKAFQELGDEAVRRNRSVEEYRAGVLKEKNRAPLPSGSNAT